MVLIEAHRIAEGVTGHTTAKVTSQHHITYNALINGHGVETRKAPGKISKLESLINEQPLQGSTGIAHTRWATHGAPTECNAHPHTTEDGTIAVVHNGIIENASALRTRLTQRGHTFTSETEV